MERMKKHVKRKYASAFMMLILIIVCLFIGFLFGVLVGEMM